MPAIVVYESLWGNTAAVARAIAEGIGPDARALSTAEATPAVCVGADLIVCGSPLLGFSLPTESMRSSIGSGEPKAPTRPDLSHPSMRTWLDGMERGTARSASFETRVWWSPGSAAKQILEKLEDKGYERADKPNPFMVTGRYGPLKHGELERAREWGASLARSAS